MSLADLSGSFGDRVASAILGSVSQRARHGWAAAGGLIRSNLMVLKPLLLLGSTP